MCTKVGDKFLRIVNDGEFMIPFEVNEVNGNLVACGYFIREFPRQITFSKA